MEDVGSAIFHYITERCKTDVEFAVQVSLNRQFIQESGMHLLTLLLKIKVLWLLEAYCADGWLPSCEQQRGLKIVKKILDESSKQK